MPKHTPIILLHGLYETTWYMKILANRLARQGFATHLFRYYSLKEPMTRHSERLTAFVNERGFDKVHLVGHSLGGLVIRQFLHDNQLLHNKAQPTNIGRVVTLGTPHLGSVSAHYLHKLAPAFINNAFYQSLDGHCPPLPSGVELGAIAGIKPQGLGKPFLTHHSKSTLPTLHKNSPTLDIRHDGTVYVFETKLPEACDHLILPVSHTGMLFDDKVSVQVGYFLENGVFWR